jgi:hypothetical protein
MNENGRVSALPLDDTAGNLTSLAEILSDPDIDILRAVDGMTANGCPQPWGNCRRSNPT